MKKFKTLKPILAFLLALIMLFIPVSVFAADDGIIYSEGGKTLIEYSASLTDKKFAVPYGVEVIGEGAFAGNAYIESVTLPETVKTIEHCAFKDCTGIRSVLLPANLEKFYQCDNYSGGTFEGCENITVDENSRTYKSVDGVVYSKDGRKLICGESLPLIERIIYSIQKFLKNLYEKIVLFFQSGEFDFGKIS